MTLLFWMMAKAQPGLFGLFHAAKSLSTSAFLLSASGAASPGGFDQPRPAVARVQNRPARKRLRFFLTWLTGLSGKGPWSASRRACIHPSPPTPLPRIQGRGEDAGTGRFWSSQLDLEGLSLEFTPGSLLCFRQ